MQSQSASDSTALRYAIIGGAAGIAPMHIRALQQLPGAQIVGLSDINAEGGAARAAELDCPFFVDHREMLADLKPDVAVICAPHPFHPPLALDAFAAGAHVLVEKPIAVSVGEADTMIEAADRAGRLLVVSFQQRFRPAVEYIRRLIDAGELGTLVRVLCTEPWYRPAAYYRSASWRGTWQGEGGGVLMNQAPHTLDLLCAFVGLPHKVWGWTRTIVHAIEVEDTAQAMLEYSNGAPGYLNINTVEHGLKQRIEIIGDRAALEWEGDQLTIHRFKQSLSDFRANSTAMFAAPEVVTEAITVPAGDGGGHLAVYRDLQEAIATGRTPRTDGRSALMALELANAITLSSYTDRAVTLPVDRAAYSALLAELRQGDRKKGRQGD
jgi:UDP-N-acetyl-2-amino-2-deoxyglucuronate dehydrogenase